MGRPRDALAEGTELAGYVIGEVLGRGGFGITYAATDALYPDVKVAIKEFLPHGLAVREAGDVSVHPSSADRAEDFGKALVRFGDEARTLVALRHPHIVEVQRFIRAHGTAYVVMKYEEGTSLGKKLEGGRTMPEDELRRILTPLLAGLESVHAGKFVHRDIKPDNIYLRRADGLPVLLDFGAARQAMAIDRKTSLTEIVTPGYAPYEQYDRHSEQGPYTDVYALGATLYRCVTGARPPDAPHRVGAVARAGKDPMTPAAEAARGRYSPALLGAIDQALAVFERDRPQSIAEFRELVSPKPAAKPPPDSVVASAETLALGQEAASPAPTPAETAAPLGGDKHRAVPYVGASRLREAREQIGEAREQIQARDARGRDAVPSEPRKPRRGLAFAFLAIFAATGFVVWRYVEEDNKRIAQEKAQAAEDARKKAEEEERRRKAAAEEAEWSTCFSAEAPEQRIAACTRVIERSSSNTPRLDLAYAGRGFAYYRLKDYQRAYAEYDQAIKLNPQSAHHFHGRGTMNDYLGRYRAAVADYDTAIGLDPKLAISFDHRGAVYYRLGEYSRALLDFNQAIALNPDDAQAHYNRGQTHLKLGDRAAGIRDLRAALRKGFAGAGDTLKSLGVAAE